MTDTRTVTLPDGHQDTETLINGVWAITHCTLGNPTDACQQASRDRVGESPAPQPEAST